MLDKTDQPAHGAVHRSYSKRGLRQMTATARNVDSGKNSTKRESARSAEANGVDGATKRSKVY